ncbi:MAG: DsbC family protein [Mariprofundaceae bacterium]
MFLRTIYLLASIFFVTSPLIAAEAVISADIEKKIRSNITNMPVEWIKTSPIDGLYTVKTGKNVLYTNSDGTLLVSGHIFDTATRKDLTAALLEDINRVPWDELPLENAVVSGDKKGTAIAIFTDPDCPYCRKLEKELDGAKGIKIYTFLMPLEQLHPEAKRKSEAIWCAKDQHKAMQSVMIDGKDPGKGACANPIQANLDLAKKLGITGTPTIIAQDGRKRSGVMAAAELKAWVEKK